MVIWGGLYSTGTNAEILTWNSRRRAWQWRWGSPTNRPNSKQVISSYIMSYWCAMSLIGKLNFFPYWLSKNKYQTINFFSKQFRYMYTLARTQYTQAGCKNLKVRPVIPQDVLREVRTSNAVKIDPLLNSSWVPLNEERFVPRVRGMLNEYMKRINKICENE